MFQGLKLTNEGIKLLTNLLAGHRIVFTCIKMGSGYEPRYVMELDDLVEVKQVLTISRSSVMDNETVLIGANLLGSEVKEAFYWREVGVFAKDIDGDNVEHMFSYDNADDEASYIPAGGAVAEQLIDLNIVVGNAENVTIEIDKSIVVPTKQEMEDAITKVNNDLTTKIDTDIKSVNTALSNHIKDKTNPHAVTKKQVGLSDVENQANASEGEARGGVVDNKVMTPLKTKLAIEALSAMTDGNVIIKISDTKPNPQVGKTIIWIDTSDD